MLTDFFRVVFGRKFSGLFLQR